MKFTVIWVAFCIVCTTGCERAIGDKDQKPRAEVESAPTPTTTPPPIPAELLNLSSSQLCDRLADIKVIPTFEPTPTDPIYEALIAKGDAAISCLVDKIPDKSEVPDPRYSVPIWQHYAVGDTAVFILTDILRSNDLEREKLLIEMLPPKSQEEWKTNGIYAYFNYVSEAKNRKKLQEWWKNWIKKNHK